MSLRGKHGGLAPEKIEKYEPLSTLVKSNGCGLFGATGCCSQQ